MSGRAKGRHTPRTGEGSDQISQGVDPNSPTGREIGVSDRQQGTPSPIPGGKEHISNAIAFRTKVPAPNPDDFTDLPVDNLHGVAPTSHMGLTRAQLMRGKLANRQGPDQYYTAQSVPVRPIPVFVVENEDKGSVFRAASPYALTLGAQGAQATRLCGRDPKRTHVMLLNESTSSDIRFATRPTDLNNGGGALLPWPGNSYMKIETQDELYAVSADSGTPKISIVQVYDQSGTGE